MPTPSAPILEVTDLVKRYYGAARPVLDGQQARAYQKLEEFLASGLRLPCVEDNAFNMLEAVLKLSIPLQLRFHAQNRATDRTVLGQPKICPDIH
jgi:hypothetical protein